MLRTKVEIFCKVGSRESELVTLLKKHHFKFAQDEAHILPHPLPKNYPTQRPGEPDCCTPLPVAYLDKRRLYISNEDVPELARYHDRLRGILAKF